MALYDDGRHAAVPLPHCAGYNKQSRRCELEKEVAGLERALLEEKILHDILESALIPQNSRSTLHIPSFLPIRAKELLAELVMVEEEIAQLEREISRIHGGLSNTRRDQQQEIVKVSENEHRKENALELPSNKLFASSHLRGGKLLHKIGLETKSLFYINQAIKGDYLVDDFASNGGTGSLTRSDYHDHFQSTETIADNASRKSARTLRASSPMLPAKHASSKIRMYTAHDVINELEKSMLDHYLQASGSHGYQNR